MSNFGNLYVIIVNPGVRPSRLKKFLVQEWIPTLTATAGCLDVEMYVSLKKV